MQSSLRPRWILGYWRAMAGNYERARATDGKKLEVGRTFQAEHRQGSEAQLTQLKNQREQALWAGVESPGTKLKMVVGHWGATRGFRAGGSHSQIGFVQGPSGCHEEEFCLWDKTGWEPRELPGSTGGGVRRAGGDHRAISGFAGSGPGSMGGAAGLEGRC